MLKGSARVLVWDEGCKITSGTLLGPSGKCRLLSGPELSSQDVKLDSLVH